MKIVKFLIFFLLFVSCGQNSTSNNIHRRVHAEYHNFDQYQGKTVKSMTYYKESPYHLFITFTDNTTLDIIANKYVLDVQE